MKSIKPGRGPSKLIAVQSIGVALFGVFWCILALCMGAWFMVPFGLIFVGMAVYQAIYHSRNATAEDRYSIVDIVDSDEESDPMNVRYGRESGASNNVPGTSVAFCPYCGSAVEGNFDFCPKCGKKLPD